MKKLLAILGGLIGLFAVLLVGYVIGNHFGRSYGAQKYTQKMWESNNMQISANNVFGKINDIRIQNKVNTLTQIGGLCKVANMRAKETYEKSKNAWNQQAQEYDKSKQNAPESYEEILQIVAKECPECQTDTYGDIPYAVLRPDSCWNFQGKKVCSGSEDFGVMEDYPSRIIDVFLADASIKEFVLSKVKYGCVGAFGGAVVLSLSN